MNEKLSVKEKAGYALTGFGHSVWLTFLSTYILFFYTDVALIRPATASLIISAATIWDAINDPLIAAYADNHTFKNGEHMRPYLVYASIPLAICLVLMFSVSGSGSAAVIFAFLTYFLFRIPSTFYTLPICAMRQLATDDNMERISLNTVSSGAGSVGIASVSTLIYALICAVAGMEGNSMVNPRRGFLFGAALVGVIVVGTSLFNYFTTKERVQPQKNESMKFFDACCIILKNRSFRQNLLLNFFYGTISSLTTGYALYYCKYVVCNQSLFIPISAMYIIGVLVSLPFVSKMFKKLGRVKMMTAAAAVIILGSAVFIGFSKAPFSAFVLCFCIGVGTEFLTVMLAINRADITDVIEKTDGKRLDGMIGNVSTFIQKLATALLTALLGFVLEASRYDATAATQPGSAIRAIVLIMGLGGLLSAIIIGFVSSRQCIDRELAENGIER